MVIKVANIPSAQVKCGMNNVIERTAADVEQALEQLSDCLKGNRKLTEDIYSKIFSPQPTKCCGDGVGNDLELTLSQMIFRLVDYVSATNESLSEITGCLSEQLGDIKLG